MLRTDMGNKEPTQDWSWRETAVFLVVWFISYVVTLAVWQVQAQIAKWALGFALGFLMIALWELARKWRQW